MSSFRSPDLLERRNNAATVKKEMLEKFRAARQDPAFEQQRLKRIALNEARAFRTAERETAKKVRAAELAAQATRAAELLAIHVLNVCFVSVAERAPPRPGGPYLRLQCDVTFDPKRTSAPISLDRYPPFKWVK